MQSSSAALGGARLGRQDEVALASRCARGEDAARLELFAYLRGPVHRTLYRILGSNRHLPDLAQDTFLEIFRSIEAYRGESSLATWADVIAARAAYRHFGRRGQPAAHLYPVEDVPALGAAPDEHAQAREAARRLYALLDRLEPAYRIAYALHVIDGRSQRDVARVTGASLIAIKNRVSRARATVVKLAARDPWLRGYLERAEGAP